jgi:polysaccharide export outer membrane protein
MTWCFLVFWALAASSAGFAQSIEGLPIGTELCGQQGMAEPCRTCPIEGVDCLDSAGPTEPCWKLHGPLPWQIFAQGEYVGPHRPAHVPEYRLRVDDQLDFAYRITRDVDPVPYELNVGDKIRVESVGDSQLDRELIIQPDGNITLRLLGQVRAAGRSVEQLREDLEQRYTEYYKEPSITVTPIEVNTKLNDLRAVVDRRAGFGGQSSPAMVTPDGTVQLPALGSVPAQGLTLDELKQEVDERYRFVVEGLEVTPILTKRAPRYIYVLGEVNQPGRFELTGPTTAMQAVALAGGWVNGGNLREMVIFRRAEDWRLIATRLDLRAALYGKRPIPADEIWLRDADIVLIPQSPLRRATDLIDLVFARGINQMVPLAEGLEILTPSQF